MSHTLKLNNGNEIPIIGLGTYKSNPGEVTQAIKDAIDAGYRHFDCAWFYGNENEVGLGIKAKIDDGTIKREDIFVTSKLWNNFHEKKCVLPKIKETLAALKLDYLDLYLIHWPFGFKETADLWPSGTDSYSDVDYLETWQGMEECVKLNLTKSIGISNFNAAQTERILQNCTIKPVVNQVEVNPNLNQKKLIEFSKKHDIIITGYCPLGRSEFAGTPGFPDPTIFDPKVKEIGDKYGKTPAQVVLNYLGEPGEVETAILNAIEAGYRHFDCAWFYGNEKEIGNAFKEAIEKNLVKREDIFITSKLWNNFHAKESVLPKLKETLSSLQIDYIDLYLIHWPMAFKENGELLPTSSSDYSDTDYLETWQAMEQCYKAGLAKNIGVSNFNISQLERLLSNCQVAPAVNQFEVNPNLTQVELRKYCKDKNIVVTAFCPLGRNLAAPSATGQPVSATNDPEVVKIAQKYNKTSAQVVLRFLVEMGISVIPKSVNKGRIQQNIDLFDFSLTEEDTSYLNSLNKNIRVSPMNNYKDHPFYPFEK